MKGKRLVIIMLTGSGQIHLTKDPCSYAYYLGKNNNWSTAYAYFGDKEIHDDNFEKHCELIYLGKEMDYKKQIQLAKAFCRENAKKINVLMLFNYGSSTYKIANAAKKYNHKITVYSKLDMGEGGFSHFYDGTISRKIKTLAELWKSRNVDLFTVENKKFYEVLKKQFVFRNRIQYLPNCVSTLNVDFDKLDKIKKENIILTVGRLGSRQKNNELLIDALIKLPQLLLEKWKVYMVGTCTAEFRQYVDEITSDNPMLKNAIVMTGDIRDRQALYALYAKAKIFILTSRWEGFSVSAVEAVYFGAYLILTDYGAMTRDITDDGKYGRVIPNYEAPKLTAAIKEMMMDDTISYDEIKEYARHRFDYNFWAGELDSYLLEKMRN